MTSPRHVRALDQGDIQFASEWGSITRVTQAQLPLLKNLSIKRLNLAEGAIREPHWHANAVELAYCLQGRAYVSLLASGSSFSSFVVEAGQMFSIPSGAVHHIENIGEGEARFLIAFRHEQPEDFSVRASFGAMTDAVLGNTYGLDASVFAKIPRSTRPAEIAPRHGEARVPDAAAFNSPYKFDIEKQNALLATPAGSARFARDQFWPILKNISMYSLRITDQGMREPHWNPETAELGYVHQGAARMTVLDPDGTTDTYVLKPGDVYFVPRAYPHHIEQLGDAPIHFLIFFDQPFPQDIGYRATGTAYSREVMASVFGLDAANFPSLPLTPADPLIVPRINPRDP